MTRLTTCIDTDMEKGGAIDGEKSRDNSKHSWQEQSYSIETSNIYLQRWTLPAQINDLQPRMTYWIKLNELRMCI